MRVPSSCLFWVTCERPTSSVTFVRLFWTYSTSRRPWHPWRCLNVLSITLERPRQPFCLRSAFNGDLASYVVVQWRHKGRSPRVKGVLGKLNLPSKNIFEVIHSRRNSETILSDLMISTASSHNSNISRERELYLICIELVKVVSHFDNH